MVLRHLLIQYIRSAKRLQILTPFPDNKHIVYYLRKYENVKVK